MANKITANNLDIYEIARCLGHCTTDLGHLCTSPKINMWNKWRPLDSTQEDTPLTDTTRKAKGSSWGLTIPVFTSIASLLNYCQANLDPGECAWTAEVSAHKHRITDFVQWNGSALSTENGYEHWAEAPFRYEFRENGKVVYAKQKLHLYAGENPNNVVFSLSDFNDIQPDHDNFANMNIGLAIRRIEQGNSTPAKFVTLNTLNGPPYELAVSELLQGTNEVALFFTSRSASESTPASDDTSRYYLLPFPYFRFTFYSSPGIEITAENFDVNVGGDNLTFTLVITQLGEPQEITGIKIYYLSKSTYENVPSSSWNEGADLGVWNVGSERKALFKSRHTFSMDGSLYGSTYTLAYEFACNGHGYAGEIQVEQDGSSIPENTPPVTI